MGSINDRWQNDESQDQCSFAGKLQAAGKLQVLQQNYVCQQNCESDRITGLGGNCRWTWEEITGCREMHEWEENKEPANVQEWERFPSAGKLQSAAKIQFCEEFAKVRKTTKSFDRRTKNMFFDWLWC